MEKLVELAKVENKRFYDRQTKAEEIRQTLVAIRKVDEAIHVLDEMVMPYHTWIPMREIIDKLDDWEKYSHSSRSIMISELNGCIEIINDSIRLYYEKDVKVRFLRGKKAGTTEVVKESVAEELVAVELAEYVV